MDSTVFLHEILVCNDVQKFMIPFSTVINYEKYATYKVMMSIPDAD